MFKPFFYTKLFESFKLFYAKLVEFLIFFFDGNLIGCFKLLYIKSGECFNSVLYRTSLMF